MSWHMRANLRRDLTTAIKARDRIAITALRSALAAIENADAPRVDHALPGTADHEHVAGSVAGVGAAEVAPRLLTPGDVRAIIEAEIAERSTAAAGYEQAGRPEPAERLRSEIEVLSRYLRPA